MSKVIIALHPARCLTCKKPIQAGEKCHWEQQVGVWCEACPEPPKLQIFIQARDRQRECRRASA